MFLFFLFLDLFSCSCCRLQYISSYSSHSVIDGKGLLLIFIEFCEVSEHRDKREREREGKENKFCSCQCKWFVIDLFFIVEEIILNHQTLFRSLTVLQLVTEMMNWIKFCVVSAKTGATCLWAEFTFSSPTLHILMSIMNVNRHGVPSGALWLYDIFCSVTAYAIEVMCSICMVPSTTQSCSREILWYIYISAN